MNGAIVAPFVAAGTKPYSFPDSRDPSKKVEGINHFVTVIDEDASGPFNGTRTFYMDAKNFEAAQLDNNVFCQKLIGKRVQLNGKFTYKFKGKYDPNVKKRPELDFEPVSIALAEK